MDDRLFRNAMGKFATGVTVISTEHNRNGAPAEPINTTRSIRSGASANK